jgi:Uma2 family endonuclease
MSALPHHTWTESEYLSYERESDLRHEFIDGHVLAMSGASREHNLITSSTHFSLYGQLRGKGCELYQGDMRVHVPSTHAYAYPDLVVVCGEPKFTDADVDTLLNPTLIIEVLSPSTESYDRGKKFQNFWQIESLKEYVLIASDQPRIESFTRQGAGKWLLTAAVGLEQTITLTSIGCSLSLAEVYEQVTFGS